MDDEWIEVTKGSPPRVAEWDAVPLEPCVRCGGKAIAPGALWGHGLGWARVECTGCGYEANFWVNDVLDALAAWNILMAWNRRPGEGEGE